MMQRLLLLLFLSACCNSIRAQVKASASVAATIVMPTVIEKLHDFEFGSNPSFNLKSATAYNRSRTIPATASFKIISEPNYTYAVALPQSVTIHSEHHAMLVSDFISSKKSASVKTDNQTLNIEAAIHIAKGQEPGLYTANTPFEIVIDYN